MKLGIGWLAGMILAVLILSSLFESHIYVVSSLFYWIYRRLYPFDYSRGKKIVLKKWEKEYCFVC